MDPKKTEDTTAGMRIIAAQELAILLDKMQLSLDTLIAQYRLDEVAVDLINKIQTAWKQYVDAELKLVEHDWEDGTICPLQISAKYQELAIARTLELDKCIDIKKNHHG